MARGENSGGRVPADGKQRPPSVPGRTQRHDLSQVPPMHGSDLQQGDVQAMEQGLRTAPARQQGPARQQRAGGGGGGRQQRAGGLAGAPDPKDFALRRLGGTMQGLPSQRDVTLQREDFSPWLPLLRSLATSPGAGGVLTTAYIQALSSYAARPMTPKWHFFDLNDAEDAAARMAGGPRLTKDHDEPNDMRYPYAEDEVAPNPAIHFSGDGVIDMPTGRGGSPDNTEA